MHRLLLVGLNHTTAPLEVREKLVFQGETRQRALAAFRQRFAEAEAVVLSTCNRVELYVARTVHGHPREEEMIDFIATFHSLTPADVAQYVYRKTDRDAAAHLFAVASSLDSMVLGETQILGQVREAYDASRDVGSAGPLLNPLFQRAINVGKEVMSQTALVEGRVSVASVAVDYARRIFDHFGDKTVLSIGAGKMAQLVLQSFQALRPGRLMICNRDPAKAAALATEFAGESAAFEKLADHIVAADIVISSTGATHPIITRKQFTGILKQRRYRPIFLIDIALPRDIEASVGELENVYLYNMDDLQQVVATTMAQRAGAVEAARTIIAHHIDDFVAWNRSRELGPFIDHLYKRCHRMAQDEVERTLNKLGPVSDAERQHLEELVRRVVNKLLHDPITRLKQSDSLHAPTAQYLHAMERLFGLTESDQTAAPAPRDRPFVGPALPDSPSQNRPPPPELP